MTSEDSFCSGSSIDNEDRYLSHLELEDVSIDVFPKPALFCNVVYQDVADEWQACGLGETWNAERFASSLEDKGSKQNCDCHDSGGD